MKTVNRIGMLLVVVMAIASGSVVLADGPSRTTYRVLVESRGPLGVSVLGKLVVDGRTVDLTGSRTPLDLTFSDTAVISGSLRSVSGHRGLKVRVFNHAYSETEPEASAVAGAVEFTWSQPGVGPRTIETPDVKSNS